MATNPKSPEKPSPPPDPIPRVSARKYRGLGDLVHAVAQPLASVLDSLTGTRLAHCRGCARRRKAWNHKFPLPLL